MDLDAVCARCALSPALSLVKYVETGRTAANTATNKPSKRKNELLGATWIADFLQKQNFDVDQTTLCSSCLSVLEPEFGRWIQPRGGTKEKQLLCAAGFWSCTSQKGLKEAHLGAERELLLKSHGVCAQSDRVRLCNDHKRAKTREKKKKGIECPLVDRFASVSLCKLTS